MDVPLKIGLVGINSPTYYAKEYKIYEQSVYGLRALGEKYNFQLIEYPQLIETQEESLLVKTFLLEKNIDFLLVQNSAFSMGNIIKTFLDMNVGLGLWAVKEPDNNTDVKLHSLVSLNLYTSIVKRCFKNYDVKTKWFYGSVSSLLFLQRFKPTLLALKAINTLKHAHIAWAGAVAPSFDNLEPDVKLLEKKYGVRIHPLPISEIKAVADGLKDIEIEEAKKVFCKDIKNIKVTEAIFLKGVVVYAALSKIAKEYPYDAMALSCWPDFQELFGIVPCVPFTELYDIDNIPVACEGDLLGVISMLVLNAMTEHSSTIMDFANIDIESDRLLLWHCGIGTKSIACSRDAIQVINHPMMNRKMSEVNRIGLSYDYYFKEMPVTIARITDNGKGIFCFNGNVTNDNNGGFTGTRGWIKDLSYLKSPVSALDLMNTILTEGIEHHLIIAEGECYEALHEFAYWTESEMIHIHPYKNYL